MEAAPLFVPAQNDLRDMIARAEAKFDAARSAALNERAERAFAINARIVRESRKHDMRRHMYAGSAL